MFVKPNGSKKLRIDLSEDFELEKGKIYTVFVSKDRMTLLSSKPGSEDISIDGPTEVFQQVTSNIIEVSLGK
jgi:hypothetical protein